MSKSYHDAIMKGALRFDVDSAQHIMELARAVATQVAQSGALEPDCYEAFCYSTYTVENCLRCQDGEGTPRGKYVMVLTDSELLLLQRHRRAMDCTNPGCQHPWTTHINDGGRGNLACNECNCVDYNYREVQGFPPEEGGAVCS